jgi:hypothetical protein
MVTSDIVSWKECRAICDPIWVKARSRSQPTHTVIVKREVSNKEFSEPTNVNMEAVVWSVRSSRSWSLRYCLED